jgi:mannosyl-3-phosphoglycerate synthase
VNIHTVQFSHILETSDLKNLYYFLPHTAFVISHKNERIETLHGVLWYLPVDSPIIIVTNCQERERADLARALRTQLPHHKRIYLIHQKDETIARVFRTSGVHQILGADGKVIDGKGEGMYIGALCAYQLGYPRWLFFFDADNFVPSALLEYTLAMSKLFISTPPHSQECDTIIVPIRAGSKTAPDLHNVRICWSSKPDLGGNWDAKIMGRCTSVVSPLFDGLLEEWFGIRNHAIRSSNAGEQGMTVQTAISLRFSSGFSVETFQLLDLLFNAAECKGSTSGIILQQYLSKSPHFHEKKGDEHVKKMIEESVGSFFHFEASLPDNVKRQLQEIYDELHLERVYPIVYPPLRDLPLEGIETLMDHYALLEDADYQDMLLA